MRLSDEHLDHARPPVDSHKPDPWEAAYARFETPAQEIRKFIRRLNEVGAPNWPPGAEIVELFCGRGNGLQALGALGFTRLEGVDLSSSLVRQYEGSASLYVCDCRHLPFENQTKDIVIIHGGLHHLKTLPEDLEQTLSETTRVLRDNGMFVAIEPWLTPFLALVHSVCRCRLARRLVPKINALATMIDHERQTYEQWLAQPETILNLYDHFFSAQLASSRWGKYVFVGRKRRSTG
jgi:ubiquinone/menaquinone biosynthesis C-methylase UbiE